MIQTPLRMQVATVVCQGPGAVLPGVGGNDGLLHRQYINRNNELTPCQAYQQLLEVSNYDSRYIPDILIYTHDDVTVHDADWLDRIRERFSKSESCVAVGLGGATSLGRPGLYRRPYNVWNMARGGYGSNQTDWQTHGAHVTEDRQVAVLDAFVMAVRVDWLLRMGGWPVEHLSHHCLDLWLGCMAARDGKEVWTVPSLVTHHGGGSSTKPQYTQAKWLRGGSLESDHLEPHRWLMEEFLDVLPIEVGQ